MGSKKRSSWSKQKAEFNASLGGMDNLFASEGKRQQKNRAEKEAALRKKACESKNRYTSKSDAEAAITSCASYGTTGLHSTLPLSQNENSNPSVILAEPTNPIID